MPQSQEVQTVWYSKDNMEWDKISNSAFYYLLDINQVG